MTQGQQSTVTGPHDSCPDCSESEACWEYSGSSDRPAVATEVKRWDVREEWDEYGRPGTPFSQLPRILERNFALRL
jgi:hypothetical protein